MITSGSGKYRVWLEKHQVGPDLVFFLGGGEKPHIGSIIVAVPGKPLQVTALEGHRDDVVLRPMAQKACEKYGVTVVVVGGVHVDRASKEEIDLLVKNCLGLLDEI